jgi:hypothetical protein
MISTFYKMAVIECQVSLQSPIQASLPQLAIVDLNLADFWCFRFAPSNIIMISQAYIR